MPTEPQPTDVREQIEWRSRMAAVPLVLADLAAEVSRQDENHPAGYPATRDGLRLGLAAAEDELREARKAHRKERQREGWPRTYEELLQVAAVAVRAACGIRSDADTRSHCLAWAAGDHHHLGEQEEPNHAD